MERLMRLFRPEPGEEHAALGTLASAAGIACNVLLAGLKLAAGFLSGSVAVAGDGLNNLTDCASSLAALLGFRAACRPADREHPYGHGRYEYVAGVAAAVLVLLAGAELGKSSLEKIFHPLPVPFAPVTMGILGFSVLLKLWMAAFYHRVGKRIHSMTLEAASQDSRNDVIASLAVLLSFLGDGLFHIRLDGFAGLGVSAFILWSGISLCRDTISPLLGTEADAETVRRLEAMVLSHPRILGIHDLQIHDYGPGRCFATVHAEMDAREAPLAAHDQLDHIEQQALGELGIHLVIHYDPVMREDWDSYRSIVKACLQEVAPQAGLHDLRIVTYHDQQTLTFDLALPYGDPASEEAVAAAMTRALADRGCTLPVHIHIDRRA